MGVKKQLLDGDIVFVGMEYGIINRREKERLINIDGVIVLTRFWMVI